MKFRFTSTPAAYLLLLPGFFYLSGCSTGRNTTVETPVDAAVPVQRVLPRNSAPLGSLPRQTVYKTNGYWNNNVAVTLDSDGKLSYFPGPGDVGPQSAPLPVAEGWLMDRQGGISMSTAFLKWTFSEYAALPSVPSVDEIMDAIIPEAKVTAVEVLPISVQEARTDTSAVNNLIRRLN